MNVFFLLYFYKAITAATKSTKHTKYTIDNIYDIMCKEMYRQYKSKVLEMNDVLEYNFLVFETLPEFFDVCDSEIFNYLYQKRLKKTYSSLICLIKSQDCFLQIKTDLIFKTKGNFCIVFNSRNIIGIHIDSILYFIKRNCYLRKSERFKRERYIYKLLNRIVNHLKRIIDIICKQKNIIVIKAISDNQLCQSHALQNFMLGLLVNMKPNIDCDYSIIILKKEKTTITSPYNIAKMMRKAFTSLYYLDISFSLLQKCENNYLPPIFTNSLNHVYKIYIRNIVLFEMVARANLFELPISCFKSFLEENSKTKNIKFSSVYRALNLAITITLIKPLIMRKKTKTTEQNENFLKIEIKSSSEPVQEFYIYFNKKKFFPTKIARNETSEINLPYDSVEEEINFILKYLKSKEDDHFLVSLFCLHEKEVILF
ncbi:hypothetical protein CWI39_0128p0020 [Hamiltosporidium magnivora]|uniref:Uncharacterized protein n=1 Tax=Hamiltosporidium magnivora TaxID=148818 RepID=A0A4Q9LKU4_9MICR|nr:hypothetical protein CWI39_0128p0020 [Hamiltosporidium magnivora]